jgi:hypothetical protein
MFAERVVLTCVFVLVSLPTACVQKPARVISDGTEYHRMATQFAFGEALSAKPPFVFRVATPWLASRADPLVNQLLPAWLEARIEDANGLKGFPGFYGVNIAASFAAILLLHAYVAVFIDNRWLRLTVYTLWTLQWHMPVRFTYFYPAYVDPLFITWLFLGLLVVERSHAERLLPSAVMIAIVSFAGAFSREAIFLVPLTFLCRHWRTVRAPVRSGDRVLVLAPIAAVLAALAIVREIAHPTQPYDLLTMPMQMLREKPLYTWVLAAFFTFGPPAIAIIAAAWQDVWRFLASKPHLIVYLATTALIGFLGGTDTERILGWGAPVMMTLLAIAARRFMTLGRTAPLLSGVLCVWALISARVFWPIPAGMEDATPTHLLRFDWPSLYVVLDKTLVMQNYYSNLWSFFGSRSVHAAQLVFDLVFTTALVVWLRRYRTR